MGDPLRAIPAVEKVLQALGPTGLPRPALTALVREHLGALRAGGEVPEAAEIINQIRKAVARTERTRLQPVINASGVLVHTNLGRAPLSPEVARTLVNIAGAYNNLEFDLIDGTRGVRAPYLEKHLALLCGAEAATVVNNCAAALVLVVRHFTRTRAEVIVSRGELVQIGGGFRIPDILQASGARLREVGATNKTSPRDYAEAIGPETGLILKVHRSNFYMAGFVESPGTRELAAIAREKRIPFVEDLGSGAVVPTERLGLEHEPTPTEILKQGVNLVLFSGDKLLGGPQAGIIAGSKRLIGALKREPLLRALRCDKLILAALEATVDLYLKGDGERAIPILAMLQATPDELRERAARILQQLGELSVQASVGEGKSQMGGGALPRSSIPSVTLDIRPRDWSLAELAARLRHGSPPVIGYIAGQRFRLDLRTVFPWQDEALAAAIAQAASPRPAE